MLCYVSFLLIVLCLLVWPANCQTVGFYAAGIDSDGNIEAAMAPLRSASLLVNFYRTRCKTDGHGYPVFVVNTFLDGNCSTTGNAQIIPGTHLGMGIISFVKYAQLMETPAAQQQLGDGLNASALHAFAVSTAMSMADYLVRQSLTPATGSYASVPRSSGVNLQFPLRTSAQADVVFGRDCTEPDKAAVAGYALLYLWQYATARNLTALLPAAQQGLALAASTADVLAKNMRNGTEQASPWGFRVDSVSGAVHQQRSANMVFALRLFRGLAAVAPGDYGHLAAAADQLWRWIRDVQIPASSQPPARSLWINFYEDIVDVEQNDRSSWAPLELARYLLEQQDRLDPAWPSLVGQLFDFALANFAQSRLGNVTVLGEQDHDHQIWAGTCTKLAAVAARWAVLGAGPAYYRRMAANLLNYMTYFVDPDGTPSALLDTRTPQPLMGWQQDSLTDVLHNYCDAIALLAQKQPAK